MLAIDIKLRHLFCHIFLNIITAAVLIMERFYKSTYNAHLVVITLGRVAITRTRIIWSIDGGIVHQWVIIATARHESNNSSCEQ